MCSLTGGKPTAIKTLSTQIAHIYEGKVVADKACDASNKARILESPLYSLFTLWMS